MGTCCETICKHRILFASIQHLAWLPQGHPQGKQKCGKNSKYINLRRYFKFNREAKCNTSIQTFICPMCTATLCNLCYIVVCCELLSTFSDKKSCNTSTTLQNSITWFVSDSWASCLKALYMFWYYLKVLHIFLQVFNCSQCDAAAEISIWHWSRQELSVCIYRACQKVLPHPLLSLLITHQHNSLR